MLELTDLKKTFYAGTPNKVRALQGVSLTLLATARYRDEGDGALLRALGEWAIACEARARVAVSVPSLTTDAWLLGLKGSADGDDRWRALAWEILVEPKVPHPAEATAVLGELGAKVVVGVIEQGIGNTAYIE